MAKRRKTPDAKLVALVDDQARTQAAFDKGMSRLFRVVNRLRKLVSKLKWTDRKIREREEELAHPLPREGEEVPS